MAGHFDLPCVARARLGPSYPTAKCEIGLMSSSFFIFYIFHQFNYISATKLWRLIAYSSWTRKHLKKKKRLKYPCRGKGVPPSPTALQILVQRQGAPVLSLPLMDVLTCLCVQLWPALHGAQLPHLALGTKATVTPRVPGLVLFALGRQWVCVTFIL